MVFGFGWIFGWGEGGFYYKVHSTDFTAALVLPKNAINVEHKLKYRPSWAEKIEDTAWSWGGWEGSSKKRQDLCLEQQPSWSQAHQSLSKRSSELNFTPEEYMEGTGGRAKEGRNLVCGHATTSQHQMGWNGNLCFCNVVAQLWPALWDPMDLEPARLLHPWTFPGKQIGSEEPFPSPGGGSQSRNQTCISYLAGWFYTTEPPGKPKLCLTIVYLSNTVKQNSRKMVVYSFYFWFVCLSWLHQMAYRLLRPQPGLTSGPQPWKHRAPTTGPPGNFQISTPLNLKMIMT